MHCTGRRCRRSVDCSHVIILALLGMATVLCVILVSLDLPFSRLYTRVHSETELQEQAEEFNKKRLQQAKEYFSSVNADESKAFYKQLLLSGRAELLICIVTAARSERKTGYLLQTAAQIDQLVKADEYFSKKFVFICNVDKTPAENKDSEFLKEYMPYAKKFGTSSFAFNITSQSNTTSTDAYEREGGTRTKEREDYVFCLNVSYSLNPVFILMLEDDVVPIKDMLRVLRFTLKRRVQHEGELHTINFSFLKLYYPEKWQGFAYETGRLLELFCWGAIGGGIFVGVCLLLTCNTCTHKRHSPLLLFLFGVMLTLFSVSVIGRQNVMAVRRLSPQLYWLGPSSTCCTQAMLYNKDILPGLTNYLLANVTVHKDLALHKYMESTGIPGFLLEPNLFRHIGMHSSLNSQPKHPEKFHFQFP